MLYIAYIYSIQYAHSYTVITMLSSQLKIKKCCVMNKVTISYHLSSDSDLQLQGSLFSCLGCLYRAYVGMVRGVVVGVSILAYDALLLCPVKIQKTKILFKLGSVLLKILNIENNMFREFQGPTSTQNLKYLQKCYKYCLFPSCSCVCSICHPHFPLAAIHGTTTCRQAVRTSPRILSWLKRKLLIYNHLQMIRVRVYLTKANSQSGLSVTIFPFRVTIS